MRLSGFTLIRNGIKFDYPFLEAIRSLLPLVDELIINVGHGDDSTLDVIHQLAQSEPQKKIKIFESNWDLDNPEKKRGGKILSEQTNLALDRCTGDWCLYLQADEVLHEADYTEIRSALQKHHPDPRVEGLLFDYVHFYGSYDVIKQSRSAYRREVRLIRRASQARSVGDAQSFRRSDGDKLCVSHSKARIFHYGWVRPPEVMREKTFFMDQLYHGDPSVKNQVNRVPHTGENYRFKRIWGLVPFKQTHPAIMNERITTKNWHWDLKNSPWTFSSEDIPKVALDLFERFTGYRLFEYRSYREID